MSRLLLVFVLFFAAIFNVHAKSQPIEFKPGEEKQIEKELYQAAKMAIEYFTKNPKELHFIASRSDLQMLERATQSGSLDQLLARVSPPTNKIPNHRGQSQEYKLNHPVYALLDFGDSLMEQNSRENLINTYQTLYSALPQKLQGMLANPRVVMKARTVGQVSRYIIQLDSVIEKYLQFIADSNVFNPPPMHNPMMRSVQNESGYSRTRENYGDSAFQCQPHQYSSIGLVNKTSLGSSSVLTSVKDQVGRGTCTAFAYAAVAETEKILNGYSASNFSEQSIYGFAKVATRGVNKKDGLNSVKTARQMRKKSYKFSYETVGPYNKSTDREDFSGSNYPKSCNGFPYSTCSNQSSQARKVGGVWQYLGSNTGPYVNSYSSLKAIRKKTTMNRLIALNGPAVLGMTVDNAFFNSASQSDGFLRYNDTGGSRKPGGHAMMYVGYISNNNLPDGVSPARGGGWVVLKNSWGGDRHDCGFVYLDHDYVKDRLTSLVTINI